MDRDEFIKLEPRLATILQNAMENKRISQAYLLFGSPRCPFEEASLFIAQTLNCESGGLACGKCDSCKRFMAGVRPDFCLIDGRIGLIKKDDIITLRDKYSMSSVENKKVSSQRMSYVILQADNILQKVANAMLKFLEEPAPGLTAILTTSNIERVLPTIKSRCEEIRLEAIPRDYLYNKLITDGFNHENSYFLSDMSGDLNRLESIGQDKDFLATVLALDKFIKAYDKSNKEAVFSLMNDAADRLKGSTCYNWFYGGLSRYFKDIMVQDGQFSVYKDSIVKHSCDIEKASKASVLLDESVKESNANMSFTGILARLGLILLNVKE